MKNKSVSDFVAASMDATLKSEAHRSLHSTQYKFASDESKDESKEDANDAADKACHKCKELGKECDVCVDLKKADDGLSASAFDVAIDSLLTASAALDAVGMANSSTLSLKIASVVLAAKGKAADPMAAMRAAKGAKKAKEDKMKADDKAKALKEKEKAKAKAEAEKAKAKAAKEKEADKNKAKSKKA